jgi:hypothetical protein
VIDVGTLAWIGAAGVVVLAAIYGLGAPLVLVRTLYAISNRRRSRYRTRHDDGLATSRFTIPVSIIVPVSAPAPGLVETVKSLLALHYPELEVIVVAADRDAVDALRGDFDLSPCEIFYRRSLATTLVRSIHRSALEPRLLVAESPGATSGDLRNCGVNLARFRYVCVANPGMWYAPDALLECMHVALEDPGRVVAVTASVSAGAGTSSHTCAVRLGPMAALRYALGVRRRLSSVGRRRLHLPPEGPVAWGIWRRDALLAVDGFSTREEAVEADLTFRLHEHFRGDQQEYRIVHVAEPAARALGGQQIESDWGRPPARLALRHAALLARPEFGRLGLLDLPRFLFNTYAAPWIELAACCVTGLALLAGAIVPGQLLLMLFIVGLGNGVLVASALLLEAEELRRLRPSSVFNLVVVSPLAHKVPARGGR